MFQRRNSNELPISLLKLIKKYRKDFEQNTLPEIRKRQYYLSPSQKRRMKDKRAEARRKKEAYSVEEES